MNEFYRRVPVAAHLVLTPGVAARLVVAFPAGNSVIALWFDAHLPDFTWQLAIAMESSSFAWRTAACCAG